MAHSGLCCGLYRGTFYLRDLSKPNQPLLSVGNAEATITQSMTEITTPNYQSLGGTACKVEYPESVGLDLILHCTSPENLARAFLGESFQKEGGSVIDEQHTVNALYELVPFSHVPDKSTIVVEDELGTPYALNTDYTVTNAGILIPETSTIPLGSEIRVSYNYGKNWKIEAQTVSQKTYEVVLDGVNVGEDGNKAVVLKAWRVRFAPTDSFSLISGSNFASINFGGEILRDESKVSGSKFFSVEFGENAESPY